MRLVIHDLDPAYGERFQGKADCVFCADGKYAPCQGCFGCWTKHPAECFMKDRLQYSCRMLGQADEVVIITRNCYGQYSPEIKNFLDRSIGSSTPLSVYRGGQMHHTLRYGRKRGTIVVQVYGAIAEEEKRTFELLAKRNAINEGFDHSKILFRDRAEDVEI